MFVHDDSVFDDEEQENVYRNAKAVSSSIAWKTQPTYAGLSRPCQDNAS
jgi:hypothetical protein